MFPEDFLAKDILFALDELAEAEEKLCEFKGRNHQSVVPKREELRNLQQLKSYAQRSCLHACFALLEAYINGLAWDSIGGYDNQPTINTQAQIEVNLQKLIDRGSLRERLKGIPKLLKEEGLPETYVDLVDDLCDTMKRHRDSLSHPSPFPAPGKFGGYDKLSLFYRIDTESATRTAHRVLDVILAIQKHVAGESELAGWQRDLACGVEKAQNRLDALA